jgi:copper chaperone NosL
MPTVLSRTYILIALALALLGGCAQGSPAPSPPEIRYGEDVCSQCSMIISDPRFAAGVAYEVSPGRYASVAFDDIGDMLAYSAAHHEQVVVAYYVHDYTSEEWLDADQAFYAVGQFIATPMGTGIAAHASRAAAEQMAAQSGGEVMTWDELAQGNMAMDHAHP